MHPFNYALIAIMIVTIGVLASRLYVRLAGCTRTTLAKLDFASYFIASLGVLCLMPLSSRFLEFALASDHDDLFMRIAYLKYFAAVLIALSVGLGLARRYYTIVVD